MFVSPQFNFLRHLQLHASVGYKFFDLPACFTISFAVTCIGRLLTFRSSYLRSQILEQLFLALRTMLYDTLT